MLVDRIQVKIVDPSTGGSLATSVMLNIPHDMDFQVAVNKMVAHVSGEMRRYAASEAINTIRAKRKALEK